MSYFYVMLSSITLLASTFVHDKSEVQWYLGAAIVFAIFAIPAAIREKK